MPTPAVSPRKEMKPVIEKEVLAKRVETIEPAVASTIRDPASTLEMVETSYPTNGEMYRVKKFAPTRLIIHYVGIVGSETTMLITGDPDRFVSFGEKSSVQLDRSESKIEYGRAFLQIAVAGDQRLQILNSVSEIGKRPGLKEDDEHKFSEFQKKFESAIKPATCSDNKCTYFAVFGQDLVKFELEISSSGKIEKTETILESSLLIPYTL